MFVRDNDTKAALVELMINDTLRNPTAAAAASADSEPNRPNTMSNLIFDVARNSGESHAAPTGWPINAPNDSRATFGDGSRRTPATRMPENAN